MKKTYISLFSGAGIGCYGFKLNDFECIATNEIVKRRIDIQKVNNKCKYESGYLLGDISSADVKNLLFNEIKKWKKLENLNRVDVIIATPPCQGMSVANHKKNENDNIRNSLVVESLKIIKDINPNFFVLENVPSFMRTICTDSDNKNKTIEEAIINNLGSLYYFHFKTINFKNYGSNSSRLRTLVIGVRKELSDEISPIELFPNYIEPKTLKEVIGNLKPFKEMGEIDNSDIFHFFRKYDCHMRDWISSLKEGESAFDNLDPSKRPHQIINGKIIYNKQKNADKYKRQFWDKVGPCVHTRNDQLASQNTIHPTDDRVFSIRELMELMTIPKSFKWTKDDLKNLNNLSLNEKNKFLKNNEINIRQSIGEAVPTAIFYQIANSISSFLNSIVLNKKELKKIIEKYNLNNFKNLKKFIEKNEFNFSISTLVKLSELSNINRESKAAFYTNKFLISDIIFNLPDFEKNEINILEPSCGVGNFVNLLYKKYEDKNIVIDLVDIDQNALEIAKTLLKKYNFGNRLKINFINDDFLTYDFKKKYDLIVGNPPFLKLKRNDKNLVNYLVNAINKKTTNICSFFLDKSIQIADYVSLVLPKAILSTPEFIDSRSYLSKKNVDCIIDFGEKGFNGVLIETIALFINNLKKPNLTNIISLPLGFKETKKQSYIIDDSLPSWIIYRNDYFDFVLNKLDLNQFKVFRDRQITNSLIKNNGEIRVIKSRNISESQQKIISISGYDSYIDSKDTNNLSVLNFLDREDVYLTPNLTYYPRVIKKPKGILVNGSVAILIPKNNIELSNKQCEYFSSDEYRKFFKIARNYQTRSLNVDSCSVYFYGILKNDYYV